MNSREEAMLGAVNDVVDRLDDLLECDGLPAHVAIVIRDQCDKLRDVQDLYRHQAGRMSAPDGGLYVNGTLAMRLPQCDEHAASPIVGLGTLIPGVGAER
jgi:hypothetical protein